jgi:RNA polymerase sigma-70 factor, ECF subfamily
MREQQTELPFQFQATKDQTEKMIEKIITANDKSLKFFAYKHVRDWELVNDIMQEVYLKVFNNIDTLNDSSAIQSWLYSITANQCKDYLRSKYFRTTFLTDDFEVITQNNNKLVENEVLEKWDNIQLKKVVSSLPKHYRDPLVLKYFYHYTYIEISYKLNISIQCLKSRIHRAKKMVKDNYSF